MAARRTRTRAGRRDSRRIENSDSMTTPTIDPNELFARVQQRAYYIFEKRGYAHGNDWSDWFEAERQVREELGIR